MNCAWCGRKLKLLTVTETGGPAVRVFEVPQTCPSCKRAQPVVADETAPYGPEMYRDNTEEGMGEHVWKPYMKSQVTEMRPYVPGEDLAHVSVSSQDTPGPGGMVARDPANHADQWYVNAEFFARCYRPPF